MIAFNFAKVKFRIFLIVLFMAICTLTSPQCHYSCHNCTTPSYTSCFACQDPADSLTILQSPQITDPLYIHSIYPSGICTAKVPGYPNGLGVLLLIISIIGLLITQSYQLFYICSTLQTLALFSLLEVPWLQPASFILHSFQYFMPINIILQSSKTKDSKLFIYGFYRLDQYMISTEDIGLITLFIIDCVLFLFIFILFVVTLFRRKKQQEELNANNNNNTFDQKGNNLVPEFSKSSQLDIQQLQKYKTNKFPIENEQKIRFQNDLVQNQDDKPKSCRQRLGKIICEKAAQCLILRKIMHVAIYVFYFFIQETALSIMVGAVFDISTLDVAIWIVYFIQIITVLIISIYETEVDKQLNPQITVTHDFGVSLFLSRECLFIVLVKKIILPIGVVIPSQTQYVYFILYLVLFVIEGSMDSRSGRVACMSRMTLWKIFQMLVTTLILAFFFNHRQGSSASNLNLITIITTIMLVIFMISFFIELVLSIVLTLLGITQVKQIFSSPSNKVQNENILTLNNTEMDLNPNQHQQRQPIVIFEMEPITRQNTKTPKNIHTTTNNQSNISRKNQDTIEVEEFNENQDEHVPKKLIKDQLVVVNNKSKNSSRQVAAVNKNNNKPQRQQSKQEGSDNSTNQSKNKQASQKEVITATQKSPENENIPNSNNKKKRIENAELRKRYGIK